MANSESLKAAYAPRRSDAMLAEDLNIIGKHIHDPEKGHLIDHVFGPDGSRRTTPTFELRLVSIIQELVAKHSRISPTRDQICFRVAGSALVSHSLKYPIAGMCIETLDGEYAGSLELGSLEATGVNPFPWTVLDLIPKLALRQARARYVEHLVQE
jgi:hypothetical protein